MSTKNIALSKIPLNEEGATLTVTTLVTSSDTGAIDYSGCDAKIIVCLKNTGSTAQTVNFLKGNGIQGVADMTITLKGSETKLLNLESGKFKQVSGENKGRVLFTLPSGVVEAAAFLLP